MYKLVAVTHPQAGVKELNKIYIKFNEGFFSEKRKRSHRAILVENFFT